MTIAAQFQTTLICTLFIPEEKFENCVVVLFKETEPAQIANAISKLIWGKDIWGNPAEFTEEDAVVLALGALAIMPWGRLSKALEVGVINPRVQELLRELIELGTKHKILGYLKSEKATRVLGYATVKGADALEAIIKPLRRGDIPGFYSRVDEADEVIRTVIREKWIEKLPEDANRIAGIVKWIEEIRLAIREAVDEQLEKLAKEADKATVYDTFLKKAQHLKNTAKSVLKDALDGFRNMPSWLKAWWLMDTLPFLVWAITNEATSWFIERPYWEAKDKIDNIERLYFTAKDALEAGELDKVEEIIENLENAINDLRNHIEANKSAFTTTGVYDTYIDTVNYYEDVLGVLKLSALIDVPEEIKGIRV